MTRAWGWSLLNGIPTISKGAGEAAVGGGGSPCTPRRALCRRRADAACGVPALPGGPPKPPKLEGEDASVLQELPV